MIHCLGPVYGQDEPAERLLADCYRNALQLARETGISSIAFPAISTGAFGYPIAEAGRVTAEAVSKALDEASVVRRVRFVLFDENALETFREAFDREFG